MFASTPALAAFVSHIGTGLIFGQLWVQPEGAGYRLCHESDRAAEPHALQSVPLGGLRNLALFTREGVFRPLRLSPDLRSGWIHQASDSAALADALHLLYPGALVDWHAVQSQGDVATHYRTYVGRQTGMYRITAMLNPSQVAEMTRACCAGRFCLKRRLWTDELTPPDSLESKSAIPCLEPCAVLMEFARKAMRMDQEDALSVSLSGEPLATIRAALEASLGAPEADLRQADFSHPLNPRKVQWVLGRIPLPPEKES